MSLIVVDIEVTQKTLKRNWEFFMVIHNNFRCVHRKDTNLINKEHGTLITCMILRGAVVILNMTNSFIYFTT